MCQTTNPKKIRFEKMFAFKIDVVRYKNLISSSQWHSLLTWGIAQYETAKWT